MLKVWIASAAAAALVVAGILFFVPESEREGDGRYVPREPPLTDVQVRAYLDIWPKLQARMEEAATAKSQGLDADIAAHVASLAAQHGLSPTDWQSVQTRVFRAVDALRFRKGRPLYEEKVKREIDEQESLARETSGDLRKQIEAKLKLLREQLAWTGPAAPEEDLRVVDALWADVDRITPGNLPGK